jgi:hypothetical protein
MVIRSIHHILEHARKSCYTRATVTSRSRHFRSCLVSGDATSDRPDAALGAATPKERPTPSAPKRLLQVVLDGVYEFAAIPPRGCPGIRKCGCSARMRATSSAFDSGPILRSLAHQRADRLPTNKSDIRSVEPRQAPKSRETGYALERAATLQCRSAPSFARKSRDRTARGDRAILPSPGMERAKQQ